MRAHLRLMVGVLVLGGFVPSHADAQSGPSLRLSVEGGEGRAEPSALRSAIEEELGIPTELATPENVELLRWLRVVIGESSITVEYGDRIGRARTRTVTLRSSDSLVPLVAMLAGNVARNEAQQMLAEMNVSQAPDAPVPPPPHDYEREPIESASPLVGEDEPARFFAEVGLTLGNSFLHSGMLADAPPPAGSTSPAWVPGGTGGCEAIDQFCVRVALPGIVFTPSVRASFGYYFLPRLALALTLRQQLSFGAGPLAGTVIGLRAQYALMSRKAIGFGVDALAGLGIGQIQAQPGGNGPQSPWVVSGLLALSVGARITYHLTSAFGLQAALDAVFMAPTFLFNVDTTVGVVFSL